jgi:hypothetical protein
MGADDQSRGGTEEQEMSEDSGPWAAGPWHQLLENLASLTESQRPTPQGGSCQHTQASHRPGDLSLPRHSPWKVGKGFL